MEPPFTPQQNEARELKLEVEFNPLKSRKIQLFLAFLFGMGFSAAIFFAYPKVKNQGQELEIIAERQVKIFTDEEIKKIVEEVGRIAVLPKNEIPIVGSVKDALALKGEKFFENAQNGDIILMYKQAGKAFLYNARARKIVNIGPFGEPKRSANPSLSPEAQDNEASSSADLKEVDNQ